MARRSENGTLTRPKPSSATPTRTAREAGKRRLPARRGNGVGAAWPTYGVFGFETTFLHKLRLENAR